MCGRFLNKLPAAEIARIFRTSNPLPNYPARYSIAPTDQVLTVRFNAKTQAPAGSADRFVECDQVGFRGSWTGR
jgi:putative SOS response-associated peptidase YedK